MKKEITELMFSKKTDHWSTPKDIYEFYEIHNYYDPCPLNSKFNGLKEIKRDKIFINPPYSDIKTWVDYSINQIDKGLSQIIVLLVPSRTDTKWFHKLLHYGVNIQFIKGRLKFGDQKNTAPFPSCFITLRPSLRIKGSEISIYE